MPSVFDIGDYVIDDYELVIPDELGIVDAATDEEEDDDDDETWSEEDDDVSTNTRQTTPSRRRIIFVEEEEEEDQHEQALQVPVPHPNSQISRDSVHEGHACLRIEQGEASSKKPEAEVFNSSASQEMDGVCCPICFNYWSSLDGHEVCCLPCGHVFGFKCIERWFKTGGRKCPQCNRRCGLRDIIKLYVSRIAVVDGEQQKKVLSLQAENEFLKMKIASLEEKICHHNVEKKCKAEVCCLENLSSEETRRRTSEYITSARDLATQEPPGNTSMHGGQGSSCLSFALEAEFRVEGARAFDMDTSNQVLILARRLPSLGGNHVLTKISMMYPHDSENIQLPHSTKAVKDLHVSPSVGKLALFASLGKKLSVLSMESNNIVLTYDLPGSAWSCSWDLNSPHHVYAGLQNGMLLVFDIRQTARPMECIDGLSFNPIHTIHSLLRKSSIPCDVRTVLTASSIGPCIWKTGGVGERPFRVPEMENQDVCISIAYCPSTDDIVASFRPKIQTSADVVNTQPSLSLSPSPAVVGKRILGSHVHIKRVGGNSYQKLASSYANVNDVRMLKSAIVNIENCNPLFAYGDELTHRLRLHELPSLRVTRSFEPHRHPILDVKFAASIGSGVLGCISEDRLQLFSAKLS